MVAEERRASMSPFTPPWQNHSHIMIDEHSDLLGPLGSPFTYSAPASVPCLVFLAPSWWKLSSAPGFGTSWSLNLQSAAPADVHVAYFPILLSLCLNVTFSGAFPDNPILNANFSALLSHPLSPTQASSDPCAWIFPWPKLPRRSEVALSMGSQRAKDTQAVHGPVPWLLLTWALPAGPSAAH